MRKFPLLLAAGSLLSLATAHAQLAHRYMLSDLTDSVGGANATAVNGGATLANGMLTTTGAGGDYLSLPSTIGTGITGDFSIQTWVTQTAATAAFSSLFSLSSSTTNFILLNPNRNGGGTTTDFEQTPATGTNTEINITQTGGNVLLPFASLHQITVTYSTTTGTATLYNNATQIGSAVIGAGFNFQTATAGAFDGINGNSPFGIGDGSFTGSTTDFRIFSQALTTTQVSTLNGLGADASNAAISSAIPEPSTWMAMLAGMGALLGLQRFRRSAV